MKTGTPYYASYASAVSDYRKTYAIKTLRKARLVVDNDLSLGAILIGRPALRAGERLTVEDARYFIEDDKP